jgi:hypothetical protein
MLYRDIKPESQSGSPVVSQATGKVIGIVAAVGDPNEDLTRTLYGGSGGLPRMLVLSRCSKIT